MQRGANTSTLITLPTDSLQSSLDWRRTPRLNRIICSRRTTIPGVTPLLGMWLGSSMGNGRGSTRAPASCRHPRATPGMGSRGSTPCRLMSSPRSESRASRRRRNSGTITSRRRRRRRHSRSFRLRPRRPRPRRRTRRQRRDTGHRRCPRHRRHLRHRLCPRMPWSRIAPLSHTRTHPRPALRTTARACRRAVGSRSAP